MSQLSLCDVPAPCWITDDQGVVGPYNARLAQWAGLVDPGASAGAAVTMAEWLTPAGRIFFETHVWPTLRRDGVITEIFVFWQPQGRRLGAYVSAKRLESATGPQYLWLLFVAEDRQAYEQALIQARQKAQAQAEQLRDAHTRLRMLNAQLRQQVDQTEAEKRYLAELVTQDPLTGLGNRRSLQALSQVLASRPVPKKSYAVLMIDIDHFKTINDRYGHARGDVVLTQVAQCLLRCARHSDRVIRYGGEEFALVLPDVDASAALAVAARVHDEVARAQPGDLAVTVSIGVAVSPSDDADLYEVLQMADTALYAAKAQGRNTTVCHSDSGFG